MLRVALYLLAIAFYIYAIIDVARTPKSSTRTLPKYVWLIIAVVLPIIGGLFWLLLGRTWPQSGFRSQRRSPRAPDDDPKFLRTLEDRAWSDKMRKRREQNP
ncbi:MAG: PLD nuclease N-terminal domain-containing protein [Candidatus Nanopelagicales bacterium]|nr:PLD nuclease N-terminal domain-containing protein [Candidatus Nanopelagicales bacterium]MCF8539980.1 PLD nuclease N-terminal domain-containing protein [Candidatus Nanopelagicales bacterium]MCF8551469.1 PLD nuclease N-terminal domain-containing protein [Candidatus Nanopelagicales bacterium]